MPATTPCLTCGQLSHNGTRCPSCQAVRDRAREQARGRPNATARGYGSAWQATSRQMIARHPWCTICGTTTDLTVDHILAKANGGTDAISNLQVMCRRHNSSKRDR